MKNKHVGLLVILIALTFFIIIYSYNYGLEKIITTSCNHGSKCPMYFTLETQKIISYSLIGFIMIIGLVIAFFIKETKSKELPVILSKLKLSKDEQKFMDILKRENGSVYQSDLIKETGLSKVKVTRTLDRLEGKKLIERKRRGMTNIILLK